MTAVVPAQSQGTALASLQVGRWPVEVHSVFRRACNLIVYRNGHAATDVIPQGLVTVAASEVGNLPNGVLVSLPASYHLKMLVHRGESGTLARGALRLPGLTIELAGAQTWDSSLSGLRGGDWAPGWRERWELAVQNLAEAAPAQSLGAAWLRSADTVERDAFSQRGQGQVWQLCASCVELDSELAGSAVASLIGLGPGLTPAGDDLLVGLFAGLGCHRVDGRRQSFLEALAGRVRDEAQRTTTVSRAYLEWAVRGDVTERLHDLARAVTTAESQDAVRLAARRAIDVGSTSGADGVCGLLLGLSAWMRTRNPCRVRTQVPMIV